MRFSKPAILFCAFITLLNDRLGETVLLPLLPKLKTTFGISRDDSGKFLNDYIENKIFDIDPFISIDDGVGQLIEMASINGKKQNKDIKLGICGEHGGDPKSINFCAIIGLNYVSCSPYRVPVARLSAAQAQIKKN